jgi:formylglycine-generating enzyme required for sulfatase activity
VEPDGHYVIAGGGWLPPLEHDYSTVHQIHKNSLASQTEKTEADMKAYTNTIPGTDLDYEMVAIPGGEFIMGSPATEKLRAADEGPQQRVKVSPFWMGKYEVRWQEYILFVYAEEELQLREKYSTPAEVFAISDAVTRPSKPYIDMSYGMGKKGMHGKGYPAIAMTQHAANKFCQWLSAKTGHFYRLPTEAEWEYAARAGTTTAYFFGDDPAELPKYAWFFDNADSSYRTLGKKLPNPWGLYDIYGNVAEWVLDQYDADFYKSNPEPAVISDPWNKATRPYPQVVRGGSYDDDPNQLRSAVRLKSSPAWKKSDTSLPKSIWWLPDCPTVGFRIVRPLHIAPPEEMAKYWMSGVEKD